METAAIRKEKMAKNKDVSPPAVPTDVKSPPKKPKKQKLPIVPCLISFNNQLMYLQSSELIQFKFEQLISILLATRIAFRAELLREAQTDKPKKLEDREITILEGLTNGVNQILLANPKMQEIVEGIEATYRISIARA